MPITQNINKFEILLPDVFIAAIKKKGYNIVRFDEKYHTELTNLSEEALGVEIDNNAVWHWDKSKQGKNKFCLVALDALDQVVGFIRFNISENPNDRKTYIYLRHMAVDPAERSSGVGSSLLGLFYVKCK